MANPTPTDLLAWAVTHIPETGPNANDTTSNTTPPVNVQEIDRKWIEVILGKPDSARMKDLITTINETSDVDMKVAAFDELELLLESLDNANDLQPLNLWKTLISFLDDSEPKVRMYAAWVMGTAVQNNEKAQNDFERNGGLVAVLNCIGKETDAAAINKGLYCISSAIRANQQNLEKFLELGGVAPITKVCMNGNEQMGRRVMFLINALIAESTDSSFAALFSQLDKAEFTSAVMGYLDNHGVDEDVIEQTVLILTSLNHRSKLIFESSHLVPVLKKLHSRIESLELKASILELSNKLE